jgi:hypothetical protein
VFSSMATTGAVLPEATQRDLLGSSYARAARCSGSARTTRPDRATPHWSPDSLLSASARQSKIRGGGGERSGPNCFVLCSAARASERFGGEPISQIASYLPANAKNFGVSVAAQMEYTTNRRAALFTMCSSRKSGLMSTKMSWRVPKSTYRNSFLTRWGALMAGPAIGYGFFFCCRFRNRTPGLPPFSSMNSTPAASKARARPCHLALSSRFLCRRTSAGPIAATPITDAWTKSRIDCAK